MFNWLTSLFVTKKQPKKRESTAYVSRQGEFVPVDEAFKAWSSGDLNEMIRAASTKTNPIDRHFLLQSIVGATYKLRKEEEYRKLCIEYAKKHLQEFPTIAPALKEDMDGTLPRVTTFQYYATVLTEDGNFNKAIAVCEEALKYDLHDNTQSGFEGRIERIRKKAEKANA